MGFELRDYQNTFERNLAKEVSRLKHVIGQSPGGTGKTLTFVSIANKASAKGNTVFIITDRSKVYDQNLKAANNGIGINPDTRKDLEIKEGGIYVCMAQTLKNRPLIIDAINAISKPALVIIDECHSGIFSTLLDQIKNRITIGFTATPNFREARHLPEYYKGIVMTEQIDWFIQHPNKYLCTYQHIERVKPGMLESLVKRGIEFTEASQDEWFSKQSLFKGLEEDVLNANYRKAMVFCSSIKHAEKTYKMLQEAGVKCAIGHSMRADENEQLAAFRDMESDTNVMVSVSSYTTGFDFPEVDHLFLFRAFGSLILYLQTLFRGNRPITGIKDKFVVYDYGQNASRHGLYWFDREWDKLWNTAPKRKESDAIGTFNIKHCVFCDSIISLMARVCEYCQKEQPENERELAEGVKHDTTERYNALIGRKVGDLTPEELALYAKLKNKTSYAMRITKSKRQREIEAYKWAVKPPPDIHDPLRELNSIRAFGSAMGYKPSWAIVQEQLLMQIKEPIMYANIELR